MSMNRSDRREFSKQALAAMAALAAGAAPLARAQGAAQLTEGRDFVRLNTPAPTSAAGKIEVVEFFWYGCPACFGFEPALESWVKRLPADVAFRRVPAVFNALWESYAKMFYALESMGQIDALHRRIFNAIHMQRQRLDKEEDMVKFVSAHDVDGAKFGEALRSFGVATKVRQAKQLIDAFKIDGVPALGVQGRFFTSPQLAGGPDRALMVADQLVARARKGA
jgi:protein dithiol oxidoreductase (disulfide-forming)